MRVKNILTMSNADFLAEGIRHWQEALERKDYPAFQYWAVWCFCLARELMQKT